MKAKDLIISILTYHQKKQFALWTSPSSQVKGDAGKYKTLESFLEYVKTDLKGRYSIRLSEKQNSYLQNLLFKEKLGSVEIQGVKFSLGYGSYLSGGVGGTVGRKADHTKKLLKFSL